MPLYFPKALIKAQLVAFLLFEFFKDDILTLCRKDAITK